MHHHFATICSKNAHNFHHNVQKLTDNMKHGQILNIVKKYSLFGRW